MISSKYRIMLILSIALFLILLVNSGYSWGWVLIIPLLYMIYSYFSINSIWLSYSAFQKNNYSLMTKYLDEVPFPRLLNKKHRAKYHLLNGLKNAKNEEDEIAIDFILRALQIGLARKNDEAIAYAFLSTLNIGTLPEVEINKYLNLAEASAESENIHRMINNIRKKTKEYYSKNGASNKDD